MNIQKQIKAKEQLIKSIDKESIVIRDRLKLYQMKKLKLYDEIALLKDLNKPKLDYEKSISAQKRKPSICR